MHLIGNRRGLISDASGPFHLMRVTKGQAKKRELLPRLCRIAVRMNTIFRKTLSAELPDSKGSAAVVVLKDGDSSFRVVEQGMTIGWSNGAVSNTSIETVRVIQKQEDAVAFAERVVDSMDRDPNWGRDVVRQVTRNPEP